jgi:hypothetical protein
MKFLDFMYWCLMKILKGILLGFGIIIGAIIVISVITMLIR